MAMASAGAFAQRSSTSIPPRWMHKLPKATNNTFRYEQASAEAKSPELARQTCLSHLLSNSGMSRGVVVVSESNLNKQFKQYWVNGHLTEKEDITVNTNTNLKGSKQMIYVNKVAEYWKVRHGQYTLTTLYAKSELGRAPLFDNVELTDKYGARGFIRSLIVPGWGQLYKGSTVKGSLILGGTAVLAGGIIFTESMRSDYANKITRTHDAAAIKSYTSKCDNWRAARNITIGAAGALYIYNLIDAIVAPGAQRVVVHNYGRRGGNFAVLPTPTENGAALSAQINF